MRFVPRRLVQTADISRGDRSWQSFLRNALSVVLVLALLYLALGALAEFTARTIPDSWEARLFSHESGDSVDSQALARADAILEKLIKKGELRDLPYRLRLVDDRQANAFAFPGGEIGLTQALLDSVDSETGLAMVLGHELGHHQARHPLRRMGRRLLFDLARIVLFGGDGNAVVNASMHIADSGYTRRQERGADAFGLRRVHEVYGRTDECLEFFEELQQGQGADEVRWAAFLRSHPLTSNRIAELRQLQQTLRDGD